MDIETRHLKGTRDTKGSAKAVAKPVKCKPILFSVSTEELDVNETSVEIDMFGKGKRSIGTLVQTNIGCYTSGAFVFKKTGSLYFSGTCLAPDGPIIAGSGKSEGAVGTWKVTKVTEKKTKILVNTC